MEANQLTPELQSFINVMVLRFLNRVEDDKKNRSKNDDEKCYWKWVYTGYIAEDLNIKADKARRYLNKLVEMGLVDVLRNGNSVSWAVKNIKGFKQSQFPDYYEPVN